jgi:hypothetical protein
VNVSPVGKGVIREYLYSAGSTTVIIKDITPTKYPDVATCFNINSIVWLQAKPAAGWEFNGWSGDISTKTNPTSIKLGVPKSIIANFKELPPPDPNSIDNDLDGYTEIQGDCNDNNIFVFPGAEEICGDGIDNDCSEGDAICRDKQDLDGDCFTPYMGDCNDDDPSINPSMIEICGDKIDQNCDGKDLACPPIPPDPDTIDHDGDKCSVKNGDCNDNDITIYPGATEIPNDGIDQDCNGTDLIVIDPEDIDDDGDSYTENQGDCNDTNSGINPDVIDICGNAIDENCNGKDAVCTPEPKPDDDDDDTCFINTLK